MTLLTSWYPHLQGIFFPKMSSFLTVWPCRGVRGQIFILSNTALHLLDPGLWPVENPWANRDITPAQYESGFPVFVISIENKEIEKKLQLFGNSCCRLQGSTQIKKMLN